MMDEVDHYAVLGLSDDEADEEQIKKAFRKLAKESHPDKNPGISPHVYRRVQRARDVLLDPKLREAHKISRRHKMKKRGEGVSQGRVNKEKDKRAGPGTFFKSKDAPSKGAAGNWRSEYANKFAQDAKDKKETPNFAENSQSNANQFSSGPERPEAKAKKETPNFGDNARSNQYSCPASSRGAEDSKKYPNFAGDAEKKKYNFFSTRNAKDKKETPVGSGAEPMDTDENLPHEKPFEGHAPASYGTGAGQSTRGANRTTDEPHIQEVFLTLEMVATGCIKDMYFTRPKKLEDGTMGKEELLLSFEVKPGWKAGSKVTFGKAIQTWKNAEKDIVFVMRDAVHPIFTRDGSNLLYTAHVTAAQVELGSPIGIPTLGGGKKMLVIEPDYVDHPELRKTIKGEGLPFPKEPTKKGDLIVKFVSAS